MANKSNIVESVKNAEPRRQVKKHDVVRAVVVRQKKAYRRKDGSYIRFEITRVAPLGGTNLVGDWKLLLFTLEFV